jgi:hypothetical protein
MGSAFSDRHETGIEVVRNILFTPYNVDNSSQVNYFERVMNNVEQKYMIELRKDLQDRNNRILLVCSDELMAVRMYGRVTRCYYYTFYWDTRDTRDGGKWGYTGLSSGHHHIFSS